MNLEIIKEINIDFNDTRYISINAKQYDKSSRYILVTCYNHGAIFPIDNTYNYVYVRARKPDDNGVFNTCEITSDGKILVELTPQMLSFVGKIFVDLVIVHNEPIPIDSIEFNNGKLVTNENTSVVSTMLFCVNVIESSVDNDTIESSSEYGALNELLLKATEDYSYVIAAASISESNAKDSESKAENHKNNALNYAENAKTSAEQAELSKNEASQFAANAKASEDIARTALAQAEYTLGQIDNVYEQVESASNSATAASNSAIVASNSATLAESYAVGGTNTRTNEDTDNAKYYYTQTKNISDSVGGSSFNPRGTIVFSELESVEKNVGDIYHISNSFTTDSTFKKSGMEYPAGTNVYYTIDEKWDCFDGEKILLSDDGNGNVNITSTYNFISTYDGLNEIIERVKALENQVVLGIN